MMQYIFGTNLYNIKSRKKAKKTNQKYLFAAAVGRKDKLNFEKIIQTFGCNDFDYLIFVYDDTEFRELIYEKCFFIREKGFKWYFGKKYLTPEYCEKYGHIFFWDGDIDIRNFSYKNFVNIMERNNLEMAQPSLTKDSYFYHAYTLKNEQYKIGRFVDFVEIMVPVFTNNAWLKFWHMVEKDYNYWGCGYDNLAKSFCRYHNMGIVDQESVRHTNPVRVIPGRREEMSVFFDTHPKFKKSLMIEYGGLK